MRDLDTLEREYRRLVVEVAQTRAELNEARKIWRQRFIDAFDGGMGIRKIAIDAGVPFQVVSGILFRSGRTEKGRDAVREQIASQVEHQEGVQT